MICFSFLHDANKRLIKD